MNMYEVTGRVSDLIYAYINGEDAYNPYGNLGLYDDDPNREALCAMVLMLDEVCKDWRMDINDIIVKGRAE